MSNWKEKSDELTRQEQTRESAERAAELARLMQIEKKAVQPFIDRWTRIAAARRQTILEIFELQYVDLYIHRSLCGLNQEFWRGRGQVLMIGDRFLNWDTSTWVEELAAENRGYNVFHRHHDQTHEVGYALCLPYAELGTPIPYTQTGLSVAVLYDNEGYFHDPHKPFRIYGGVKYSMEEKLYGEPYYKRPFYSQQFNPPVVNYLTPFGIYCIDDYFLPIEQPASYSPAGLDLGLTRVASDMQHSLSIDGLKASIKNK